MTMSLIEVLPDVRSLSRSDKIQLIQILSQDLGREVSGRIESGRSYPVWSPNLAFDAAATMLEALAADKSQP
jgi:hypothetical protein